MDSYPNLGDLGKEIGKLRKTWDDGKETWEKLQKSHYDLSEKMQSCRERMNAADKYYKERLNAGDKYYKDPVHLFLSPGCRERMKAADKYHKDLEHRLYKNGNVGHHGVQQIVLNVL